MLKYKTLLLLVFASKHFTTTLVRTLVDSFVVIRLITKHEENVWMRIKMVFKANASKHVKFVFCASISSHVSTNEANGDYFVCRNCDYEPHINSRVNVDLQYKDIR